MSKYQFDCKSLIFIRQKDFFIFMLYILPHGRISFLFLALHSFVQGYNNGEPVRIELTLKANCLQISLLTIDLSLALQCGASVYRGVGCISISGCKQQSMFCATV